MGITEVEGISIMVSGVFIITGAKKEEESLREACQQWYGWQM
jgi:hypothetical protein